MQCVSRQWNFNARQNSQQTYASVTIQAESGPAAIKAHQQNARDLEVAKNQSDGSSFTFLFQESPSHHSTQQFTEAGQCSMVIVHLCVDSERSCMA